LLTKTTPSPSYDELEQRACANNIPVYAQLELTYRCNLNCAHCYIVAKANKKELTTEEIKEVLDQLADLGTLYLALTGGEIFLRDDFFDIAAYARKKSFALRLFTNATLITEEITEKIFDIKPLFVEISLYGFTAEVHEAITRTPGSFFRTIGAIKQLRKLGINVAVKTMALNTNFAELSQIKQFAQSLGADFRADAVIMPKVNGAKAPLKFRLDDENLFWYFKEVNSYWKPKEFNPNSPICNAGKGVLTINPFGQVYPCIRIPIEAGNIRQHSLQDIWKESYAMQKIRELSWSKLKLCAACQDINYCNPCPGLALIEHGDILSPAAECCRQAKARQATLK